MYDLEQIRLTVTLTDLIPDLKKNGAEWRCACPLHGGKDKGAFAVYHNGTRWKCFSGDCGSGDVFEYVKRAQNTDFVGAVKWLIAFRGGEVIAPEVLAQIAAEREAAEREELEAQKKRHAAALEDLQVARRWEAWANMDDYGRALWKARGVNEATQEYFKLGYTESFAYKVDDVLHYSPALSIPSYSTGWEIARVDMRLINPVDPNNRYRPAKSGLADVPYMTDPDLGYTEANTYLVVEGQIKSIVAWQTWDKGAAQVLGVTGKEKKKMMAQLAADLKGRDIVIMFDPDALREAVSFAKLCGGARVVNFAHKLDDAIVDYGLDGDWLDGIIKSSKFVKG